MASIIENRIFVRNVPQTASQDDLANHFGQFGQIVDLYMPLLFGSGQHKGMAFVSYESPESVKVALAHPAHEVHGEAMAVDVCLSKGKGKGAMPGYGAIAGGAFPAQQFGGQLQQGAPQIKPGRLFLTRVSQAITSEDLVAYFQQFGELEDVYVPPGGKSIAFVSFQDPSIAAAVLQAPTHEVKPGCSVNVDAAIDRPNGGYGGKGGFASGGFAAGFLAGYQAQKSGGGYGGGYAQPALGYGAAGSLAPAVGVKGGAPAIKPGRLFLTKVPPEVTAEDLTYYFQQYGDLEDVYIPPGGKAIAFVSFLDPNTASAVLQAPIHEIKPGSTVTVDAAIDRPDKGGGKFGMGKGGFVPGPRFAPY